MSDRESEAAKPETDEDNARYKGPSLTLLYSLIAVAMIAAIGLALMIVMPFYHRR